MESAVAQKPDKEKSSHAGSAHVSDVTPEDSHELGAEAGMPLFLQGGSAANTSSPPDEGYEQDVMRTAGPATQENVETTSVVDGDIDTDRLISDASTEPSVIQQPESAPSTTGETAASRQSLVTPQDTAEGTEVQQEKLEVAPAPDPRQAIAPAASAVRNRAAGSSSHSPAGVPVASAQAAGQIPQTEQTRMAATQTVENLDAEQENADEVNRAQFKTALKQAIKDATPEPSTESEAENVMKTGAANASNTLRGELATQRDATAGPLASAASTEISASDQVVPPQTDLELEQVGEPPIPVSVASVVPAPLPPERLDYSSDRGSTEQIMAQNNVSQEQLAKGKEPTFGSALEVRASAEEHESTVETRYRDSESNTRSQAQGGGQQSLAQGLEGMHGGRALQIGMVVGQQIGTQNKNETERQRITTEINKIKDKTQLDVTSILNDMETGATELFEEGLDLAEKAYAETFEEAKGGVGTWLTTWGDDWEELIEDALATARVEYLNQVDKAIDLVADFVETKLTAAKKRVSDGLTEVQKFVTGLDDSVKQFGDDALSAVTADFDAMRSGIDQRRDGLINKLTQQYKDSYERMSAMEEQLRAENKSLWQRVYDATVGAIEKIIEFKNLLLGILARAAAVVESIILDPIGFLGNLISGIKAGLDLFFGNIAEHLKQGLFGWLFGALEGAGIQIPDTFDFKGILSLIMQVLQLTYGAIRKRAVKLLGEDMVERLEQVADIFKVLITEGPAGLWRMLMEKLSSVKEMLLEEIRGFVISEIIEAGVKWLIGLLNPAAAFVKACMMIYDIIIFFIERGSQIVELVNSIINSLATIISGNVQAMAQAVSGALVRILPIAISFLAALLGLGGISGKIRKIIDKIQEPVGEAIDWVIGKAVGLAKAAGDFFTGSEKKKEDNTPETDDPEHDAKVTAGLVAIDTAERGHLENGEITRENAEEVARSVKQQHPVFTSLQVVDGRETWDYDYTASPGEKITGERKAEQGSDKPDNFQSIMDLNLVGKPVVEFNPPPPRGYSKYSREDKYFIRREDADDNKFQQLGVDENQKIVLGRGRSPAEVLRNESEMRNELGPAISGRERHHLIPLSVAASDPLVVAARNRGKPIYRPNGGLVYLPASEEARNEDQAMAGLPIHSPGRSGHPKWTAKVRQHLLAQTGILFAKFKTNSFDEIPGEDHKIPPEALTVAVLSVQQQMRNELSKIREIT